LLNWIEDEAVLDRFAAALRKSAMRFGNSFERTETAHFIVRSPNGRWVAVRDRGSIAPRPPGLVASEASGRALVEYDRVDGGWMVHSYSSPEGWMMPDPSAAPLSDEEAAEMILALAGM
jgi:hypothetical protein